MLSLEHVVSPRAEMLAYEVLLAQLDHSIKSVVGNLRSAGQLPSNYLLNTEGMFNGPRREEVARFLAGKSGFSISIAGDFQYPAGLRDCPVELFYYRGDLGILESRCVSVVGAREASDEGLARARKLSRGLAKAGFTIISGLAKGIDTAALTAAIEADGRVVGVIGTPIDASYPKENAALQEEIARKHLLISQVPFFRYHHEHFARKKLYFPLRNETMSALSEATIIIEAGETSGTLTQARAALNQGRKLLILNSCFENRKITWPARFAEKGATRVSTMEDILRELGERRGTAE
ncbi:MAG: DNA-protecting protein DprA [Lacunisphaera sp.]|nr:DNA-protecting protein DprA [Lacunisphaera sp.]